MGRLTRALVFLPLLFAFLAPPVVRAQSGGSSPGEIWAEGVGLVSQGLAFGDHGGQLFAVSDDVQFARLFSSYDAINPTPLLTIDVGFDWFKGMAVAAAETDTCLAISFQLATAFSLKGTLSCWSSASPEPRWTYAFAPTGFLYPDCDVSRDGRVIVSSFTTEAAPGMNEFRVHDPETGAVTKLLQYPLQTPSGRFDLSPDGTVLAHSGGYSAPSTFVIELATGQVLLSTPGEIPPEQALSHRGEVLVVREKVPDVAWHLRVFTREGNSYVERFDVVTPPTDAPQDFAVSDDGAVVAAGWHDTTLSSGKAVLRAYDGLTGSLLMEREFVGGLLDNTVTDVELSADGSRLAFGIWGAISAADVPELTVWAPLQDALVAAFPATSATLEVALSADGARVAAQRTNGHPNQGYSATAVRLYDAGGADLTLKGVPKVGAPLAFSVYGEPGDDALLLAAPALAAAPIHVGAGGPLLLDAGSLVIVGAGTVGPLGVFTAQLAVPPSAAFVGVTAYVQGATSGPLTLGDTLLQVTVVP